MFDFDWQEHMITIVKYAAENPWQFLYYTLMVLSPLFGLSAFLSYKLIQDIDRKERENKKKLARSLRASSSLLDAKSSNKLKLNKKKSKDD